MTTTPTPRKRQLPDDNALTILLVPDSFKGALDSSEVAEALAQGIRRVTPEATITAIPMADGGEGTVNALVAATNGTADRLEVTGAEHTPVTAEYGILPDGVVIEIASAAGLPLTSNPNPETTTTYGVGELIAHLADYKLTIGAGGQQPTISGAAPLPPAVLNFSMTQVSVLCPPVAHWAGLLGSIPRVSAVPNSSPSSPTSTTHCLAPMGRQLFSHPKRGPMRPWCSAWKSVPPMPLGLLPATWGLMSLNLSAGERPAGLLPACTRFSQPSLNPVSTPCWMQWDLMDSQPKRT